MIEFKNLKMNFGENWFEVKMKDHRLTKAEIIFGIVGILYILGLPLFGAIIGFIGRGYFYAILFSLCFVFLAYVMVSNVIVNAKREVKFKFLVNGDGVTQIELNNTFFMTWSEIVSWGFLNHNVINSVHRHKSSEMQTCLYFARKEYSEKNLKRKFDRIALNFYKHFSTEDIIVLGFQEDDLDELVISKIREIISLHCSKELERSYIDPFPVL